MTDLSEQPADQKGRAANKIRFVTAASLFDGHDARSTSCAASSGQRRRSHPSRPQSLRRRNRQRRDPGGRARHRDLVLQGGHVEYFKYAIDLLRERGGENIKVFGGGAA